MTLREMDFQLNLFTPWREPERSFSGLDNSPKGETHVRPSIILRIWKCGHEPNVQIQELHIWGGSETGNLLSINFMTN